MSETSEPKLKKVKLRKCPSCKNIVNARNFTCPRCGIYFRSFRVRRLIMWAVVLTVILWIVNRYYPLRPVVDPWIDRANEWRLKTWPATAPATAPAPATRESISSS